jgi:hypothetical protein
VSEVQWQSSPGALDAGPYALRFADGYTYVVRFGMLPFDDRITLEGILGPGGAPLR